MARPPKEFCQFIGQRRIVETLERIADEAVARAEVLPPLMLIGAAGSGKTSLAEAVARHLAGRDADADATNFRVVHAGRRSLLALREALVQARHGDVVFVDEAHALEQGDAELLYLAVDQQETLGLDDGGKIDRSVHEPIAPVSLILATNLPGSVAKALRSRAIQLELDAYSTRELREIATRVAAAHAIELTPQAARVIAEHSDGTPRSVEHLAKLLAALPCPRPATKGHVRATLRHCLGHDEHGLRPSQRRLLELLGGSPDGSARAEQVATWIGLDAVYVRTEIEDPLIRRGLLFVRPDRRRQLTENGHRLVEQLRSDTDAIDVNPKNDDEDPDDSEH